MKTRVILVVAMLLGLLFLLSGGTKLAEVRGPGMHTRDFESWGYPVWFMYVVGLWEVIGGAMLLAPSMRFYGAVLLSLDMLGAVVTNLRAGELNRAPFPLVLLILVVWIASTLRPAGARPGGAVV
jgi:putative oxidoreductase